MGYGDDSAIVATRDAGHHMTAQGFGPAVVDKSIYATMPYADRYGDLAYQAIRGREQSLIDYFGGAQSMGGPSGNAIQGVADDTALRSAFMDATRRAFGLP